MMVQFDNNAVDGLASPASDVYFSHTTVELHSNGRLLVWIDLSSPSYPGSVHLVGGNWDWDDRTIEETVAFLDRQLGSADGEPLDIVGQIEAGIIVID